MWFDVSRRIVLTSAVIGVLAVSAMAQTAPAPATAPSQDAVQDIVAKYQATNKQFHTLFPKATDLADPAQRSAKKAEGVALLNTILDDIDQLVAAQPKMADKRADARSQFEALLVTLGDESTIASLAKRAAGTDKADAAVAQRAQILGEWYAAGADTEKQKPAIDKIEAMATANPTDSTVTQFIMELSRAGATDESGKRLEDIVAKTMKDPLAARFQEQLAKAAEMRATYEGKPMVISGKLPDGHDFSTADWKGKVILVDFWAVWCAPCKAELPRVKKAYAEFHEKGLEVLGVSNDYKAETLTQYVSEQSMPWPQLFDADAAADKQWNPITVGYGIHSIPTMFLIDKAGNCRTVEARAAFETLIPKLLAE